jgi:hypothetical protein
MPTYIFRYWHIHQSWVNYQLNSFSVQPLIARFEITVKLAHHKLKAQEGACQILRQNVTKGWADWHRLSRVVPSAIGDWLCSSSHLVQTTLHGFSAFYWIWNFLSRLSLNPLWRAGMQKVAARIAEIRKDTIQNKIVSWRTDKPDFW